jgi:hypothetical protein
VLYALELLGCDAHRVNMPTRLTARKQKRRTGKRLPPVFILVKHNR